MGQLSPGDEIRCDTSKDPAVTATLHLRRTAKPGHFFREVEGTQIPWKASAICSGTATKSSGRTLFRHGLLDSFASDDTGRLLPGLGRPAVRPPVASLRSAHPPCRAAAMACRPATRLRHTAVRERDRSRLRRRCRTPQHQGVDRRGCGPRGPVGIRFPRAAFCS